MADRRQKTNKVLLWSAIALCLLTGGSYTRSSADFSVSDSSQPDMFVAGNTTTPADAEDSTADASTELPAETETGILSESVSVSEVPTQTTTSEPPTETTTQEVSPEAETGIWTASGSNWYFMVNGAALTGWLTDTDGKRYYFDANGIMQTGWLDMDGKRYYLNADGVMQTGSVTIDGQIYTFGADGVLTGEAAAEDISSGQNLISYMNASAPVTPTPTPVPTTIVTN